MSDQRVTTTSTDASASEPVATRSVAGFWRRILAFVLDTIIIGFVGFILGFVFFDQFSQLGGFGRLVGFSIALFYFGMLNSSIGAGQTFGKRLMNIRVVDEHGGSISLRRAMLRYSVLALPFFLNGAMIPLSALAAIVWLTISLVVFGMGGATIYLYVFNRQTRQSLHDLISRTFVVEGASTELAGLSVWRGHFFISGAWFVAVFLLSLFTGSFTTSDQFADIFKVQRAIMDRGEVHTVAVSVGRSFGPEGNARYVSTHAVWKSKPVSFELAQMELASMILREYPDAASQDSIVVTISYGYDIGISSSWQSATNQGSPAEWLARVQNGIAR